MIRFVPMDDVRESTIRNVGTSAIISTFLNNEGTTQNETTLQYCCLSTGMQEPALRKKTPFFRYSFNTEYLYNE